MNQVTVGEKRAGLEVSDPARDPYWVWCQGPESTN